MKFFKASLLTLGVLMGLLNNNALAITFQTTGNNSWSPYSPGNYYNGSDEFIISHTVNLNGLSLASGGKITIKSGGYLKLNWSANLGASSQIIVESGGTLKLQNLTTINYSDIEVYGEIITSNGTLVNYGAGEIKYYPGAEWVMNQYTFTNYGTLTLNEDADWKNGTVSLVQGETTINAELEIKNLTLSNNAAIVGIGEVEVTGGQGSFSSTGTINGCQGNACIPPSTVGQTTYLATSFVDDGTIPEQYDGSSAPTQGCNVALQVKENITFSSNFEVGELIVSPGVTVLIESGVSLTLCNDVVNEGTIIIENGAAIVQNKAINENSGEGTFIKYRNATSNPFEYHSISSPIAQAYIPSVFMDENPCDLFCFDAATQSWLYDYQNGYNTTCAGNPVTFSSSYLINGADGYMNVGTGYFITGDADGVKTFTGTINNGDYTVDVYETSLGNQPNWNDDDWNLLGNPYPSAIDLQAFYTENQHLLTGNFYFWVDDNSNGVTYDQSNDYAVYNNFSSISANGSTVPNQYLASCQGFWAVAHTDGTATFKNSMRVADYNTEFYKNLNDSNVVIRLDLTNEFNNFNQTCIGFSPTSTDSVDEAQDAPKSDAGTAVALGTRLKGSNFSIQAIEAPGDYQTKWVDLHVMTNHTGMHTFKVSDWKNVPVNIVVWLYDSVSNTTVDIISDSYEVFIDSNVYNSRFKIGFKQTGPITSTGVEELAVDASVKIFTSVDGLNLAHAKGSVLGQVQLFDTSGKLVKTTQLNSPKGIVSMDNLANGPYVVHVYTVNGETIKQKVMWNR